MLDFRQLQWAGSRPFDNGCGSTQEQEHRRGCLCAKCWLLASRFTPQYLAYCAGVSFAHIKLQAAASFLRAKGKVKVTLLEWSSMVSPLGCALDVKFFSVLIPSARGICYRSNLISQDTVQESKVQISVFLISRSLAFFVPQILFLFYVYVCFHEGVYSVCVWVCTPSDTEARRRV